MKSLSIVLTISLIVLFSSLTAQSQINLSNQENMTTGSMPEQAMNKEEKAPLVESNAPVVNAEVSPTPQNPASVVIDAGLPAPVSSVSAPVVQAPSSAVSVEPVSHPVATNLNPVDHTFFNKIKSLAGHWDGTAKNEANQPEDKISVIYEVTAGGNAVMERLFPGTKQEMVTLYYENKGKLMLTHYSILGNRPVMQLKEAQENVFEFEFIQNTDLNPVVDTHMNSLKIAFVDQNHMNQVWMMFEGGKPAGSYSFQLTRVPENLPQ